MNIRSRLEDAFKEACRNRNIETPDVLDDELVLLETGLDSLGFAVLVTNLEMKLGYDPFTLMEDPYYPRTFGEFVGIYERFKDRALS